jgi:hypothetical protein
MSFGWTFSCFSAHLIVCKSTSAIRKVPGNAARTKTPIYCYGNISPEAPTCLAIRKRSSTRSRCA